jgi:hypothetical protein
LVTAGEMNMRVLLLLSLLAAIRLAPVLPEDKISRPQKDEAQNGLAGANDSAVAEQLWTTAAACCIRKCLRACMAAWTGTCWRVAGRAHYRVCYSVAQLAGRDKSAWRVCMHSHAVWLRLEHMQKRAKNQRGSKSLRAGDVKRIDNSATG